MDKATPTPASVDSVMALKKLLNDIAAMLSPAADSYASDDPSGAIETAYSVAVEAIAICAEVERLAAQAARDDAALYQTIGERDNYHKWADKLADGIATHLGIDIGEHTAGMGSAESNNPWANALEAIQSADPPACPNCRGSGCVQQMTGHLGPDDYEETVDCPHCNGNQTLGAAYEGVLKSLRDEREAHTRTRSIIWGWTSSRSEVNAVQHKLGNILEHLKPGNIAWVGDRLRDLIASAAAQPSQAPVVQPQAVVPAPGEDRWHDAALPPEIEQRLGPWLTNGAALHPATVNLVVRFARALSKKLAAAEVKYGYSDGWMSPDWLDECRAKLMEHIVKGDPRDVAAYCAFLWHHEASTAAAQPSAQAERAPVVQAVQATSESSPLETFEAKYGMRGAWQLPASSWDFAFEAYQLGRASSGATPAVLTLTPREIELLREIRLHAQFGFNEGWQREARNLLLGLEEYYRTIPADGKIGGAA